MKIRLTFFMFFFFGTICAQDTIFVKSGEIIPAVITEKNKNEIKYSKPGNAQSKAIYSVFISDIRSIHYASGIIADYTQPGNEVNAADQAALEMAGTMKTIRFSIGISGEYSAPYTWDNILDAWRYSTGNPGATIDGRSYTFPVTFKMVSALGGLARHWFGDEVRIRRIGSVLHASDGTGNNVIKLNEVITSVMIYYGYAINHRKNLLAVAEAGADMSFGLHGSVKIVSKDYRDVSSTGIVVPHFAAGLEYAAGKRILFSARAGYRIKRTEKLEYFNSSSDWGYLKPYSSGGPWADIGMSFNFYVKSPFGKTGQDQK
ncbi:MAG TPA: hypothetical protein VMT63_02600 [Bacteroidales bacterium]|nr:hypothetical protein [Bacteroidales bacterium]